MSPSLDLKVSGDEVPPKVVPPCSTVDQTQQQPTFLLEGGFCFDKCRSGEQTIELRLLFYKTREETRFWCNQSQDSAKGVTCGYVESFQLTMAKILVVDDDFDLCDMVREWLARKENYTVETANAGNDALSMLQCSRYDLVILDWELPDISGVDICKRLRSGGDAAPVLFLTGRNTLMDKEVGFNAGGDDYLVKPFELKELSLRVRALLRRHKAITEGIICIRDLELDPKSRRLMREGKELHLSPKEFSLLEFFMRHPNEVFRPGDLLRHVWPSDTEATDQTVRTTIKRLRQTIDTDDGTSYIANVHGHGYRMNK